MPPGETGTRGPGYHHKKNTKSSILTKDAIKHHLTNDEKNLWYSNPFQLARSRLLVIYLPNLPQTASRKIPDRLHTLIITCAAQLCASLDFALFTVTLERTYNCSGRIILFLYNRLLENGLGIGQTSKIFLLLSAVCNLLTTARTATEVGSVRHNSE